MEANTKIRYINLEDGNSIKIKLHNVHVLTNEERVEYDKQHPHEDWEDE